MTVLVAYYKRIAAWDSKRLFQCSVHRLELRIYVLRDNLQKVLTQAGLKAVVTWISENIALFDRLYSSGVDHGYKWLK